MENSLFYTQFSPLNAGKRLLGFCNFKIFWGSMPPDTPWKRGLLIQSVRLYSNLLATSIFIETPAHPFWSIQNGGPSVLKAKHSGKKCL